MSLTSQSKCRKEEAPEIYALLQEYLSVEGYAFCTAFLIYAHCIDDIIDGDKQDSEFILRTFEYAALLYSLPFYQQHTGMLLPVIKSVTNSYADSVQLEKCNEEWKQKYADVLRQNGNDLLSACVEICSGIERRREFSMRVREISYKSHHDEVTGERI